MVVETCNRLGDLSRDEEMIIVLGREHIQETHQIFKDRKIHLLFEPIGRNTAPCIGLGALYAQHLGCSDPIAFLPADHFIRDNAAFLMALQSASRVAESGAIVTLGIVPTRPETGYGYIHRAAPLDDSKSKGSFPVSAFVEKPDLATAESYILSQEYFWNAGIFVATPETILIEIKENLPELHNGLSRLKESFDSDVFDHEFKVVYEQIQSISFDYGIMEKTRAPVFVVPCDCGWSDVGSWASLYELRDEDHDMSGNMIEGNSMIIDCENSLISSKGKRLIAGLGLRNCLVIDTQDALLVADMGHSQDIRKIVDALKMKGKDELL